MAGGSPSVALAERLRRLRMDEWPVPVKQLQLAKALVDNLIAHSPPGDRAVKAATLQANITIILLTLGPPENIIAFG